jgi:hypothetical protein
LILSLKTPAHLKVTTLRASSIKSSPVCGVPSPAFALLLHTEFPKPGDQDIFTLFKDPFHGLYKGVNQMGGASIGKAEVVADGFGDAGLGEGTWFPVRKLALRPPFVNAYLTSSKKTRGVAFRTDRPWLSNVFQQKAV